MEEGVQLFIRKNNLAFEAKKYGFHKLYTCFQNLPHLCIINIKYQNPKFKKGF